MGTIGRKTVHRTGLICTPTHVGARSMSRAANLMVKWALRVTWSGEFVHSAPWSVSSQGVSNVSHGCVGMSNANAYYLWKSAKRGDPVEVTGSNRHMTDFDNGLGDWNVSWTAWKAGSAL